MKYLLITFVLFFSACSIQKYEQNKPKIIIIKTPKIKFADVGYLQYSEDALSLELFMAGKSIKTITINYLVCVDEGCMSRSTFNAEYLSASYPDKLLQNILLGKTIYNEENIYKNSDGFEQNIENDYVSIKYKVSAKEIFFKDRKNSIIFKIKDINK
ncbi:hypothetical protein [Sulfurimonas sp.]|jgi:hypothetical protein|uniref:hypothetical protein n=1 Tax=Sulfurimonas sp. TaxID=2022749 RepID=UPI0025DCB15F|nr:hypothetical protein [Sulfurimonas sp.]MBT5934739.1 hypothetical protein [Sulfurimonas sp.]